jgi:hypothetical protein
MDRLARSRHNYFVWGFNMADRLRQQYENGRGCRRNNSISSGKKRRAAVGRKLHPLPQYQITEQLQPGAMGCRDDAHARPGQSHSGRTQENSCLLEVGQLSLVPASLTSGKKCLFFSNSAARRCFLKTSLEARRRLLKKSGHRQSHTKSLRRYQQRTHPGAKIQPY